MGVAEMKVAVRCRRKTKNGWTCGVTMAAGCRGDNSRSPRELQPAEIQVMLVLLASFWFGNCLEGLAQMMKGISEPLHRRDR